jgi:cobalt-precorrin 5A hydrolase
VDALVAVMATGIVIRAVAPYLESKLTDPAVVGVDAAGKFVISLLSGHYGGANELAKIIAKGIGGTAVITTASDVTGKQSVDELAKTLHLAIQNPASLVAVNSAIVNGDRLVLVLTGDVKIPTDQISGYEIKKAENGVQALQIVNGYDAGVIVTHEPLLIAKFVKPFTILKTRCVVVGLGARKDSSADSIIEAVDAALEQVHVPLARVNRFATVDIKRNSPAMLKAVEKLGLPLEFLSVDALRSVSHKDLSPDSKMVQEKIGVGGVCERAALIVAGKNSKLILKKTKLNGVTVAIAEGE